MKKIGLLIVLATISINVMAQKKIIQTAGHDKLGEFAPTRTFKGHVGSKTTGKK